MFLRVLRLWGSPFPRGLGTVRRGFSTSSMMRMSVLSLVSGRRVGTVTIDGFADGQSITDYNLAARVVIILDHDLGRATIVAYSTHGAGGAIGALPIEVTMGPKGSYPPDRPSSVGVYEKGDGVTGNVVFSYRFLNSQTPSAIAGVAPAINGAIRVQKGAGGSVAIDGMLAQYPSVEIIRDTAIPNGYRSTVIYTRTQASGSPKALFVPGTKFNAAG